jgi:hypothetical protein
MHCINSLVFVVDTDCVIYEEDAEIYKIQRLPHR